MSVFWANVLIVIGSKFVYLGQFEHSYWFSFCSKFFLSFMWMLTAKIAKTTKSGGYHFVLGTKFDVYISFLYKKVLTFSERSLSKGF